MIRLKCLECGLVTSYKRSGSDTCPRCLVREHKAVSLVMCSDDPSHAARGTMGSLRTHAKVTGDCHWIRLQGELDVGSAQLLEALIVEACERDAREIVLDMAGIEFMDSEGLRAILRSRTVCEDRGCALLLTPAQRPVRQVLRSTGLIDRLRWRSPGSAPGSSPQPAG
jgi:anti-sigma B factor antagonist